MDHNASKYFIEHSEHLTEAETIQFAKDLFELERRGILEYRDGAWGLAARRRIAKTPEGPVARFLNKEEGSN